MKHDLLLSSTSAQIDAYGRMIGVDVSGLKTKKAKVARIESVRERVADIDVLGLTLHVPIKRMHDKRITDRINDPNMDDEKLSALMRDLLGDDQLAEVVDACTDEDGTIDTDALGIAWLSIEYSPELKNFAGSQDSKRATSAS